MLSPSEAGFPRRLRVEHADGRGTTVHLARYLRERTVARIVAMQPPATLLQWCRAEAVSDALVGGFFIRSAGVPLGELRVGGIAHPSEPFVEPWDRVRACLHIDAPAIGCLSRRNLPAVPAGDLLQAGPMLVADGVSLIEPGSDPEGFSAGAVQFDSDITAGRHPRAALGVTPTELIAVVCDGRSEEDAGMSLGEFATTMAGLGAEQAINLDGGGSASLVVGGELVCVPREEHGYALRGGRPISTAITFSRA